MEAILNVQALPLGTAVAVGGPAVALGGLSLLLLKAYVNDQRRKLSSNLPQLPGNFHIWSLFLDVFYAFDKLLTLYCVL